MGKFCERCKETEETANKQRAGKSTTKQTGKEKKADTTALEQKAEQTNSFKNQYCKTKNKGTNEKKHLLVQG